MANASFTKDEAILALDVLYFSNEKYLNTSSPEIEELSKLLNILPIHAIDGRSKNFRNPAGVLNQILSFQRSFRKGKKDVNVGAVFYEVAVEFQGRLDELHAIASAIRNNSMSFNRYQFGAINEGYGFPEGALLGHLHRIIEKRDSLKIKPGNRCEICHINTHEIYHCEQNLMSLHLTVNITKLNGQKKYKSDDFITVCPNCHAALHCCRPWLTKDNCNNILY